MIMEFNQKSGFILTFSVFELTLFDFKVDIFNLLMEIWSNLIKNRLILIEKRSMQFDTIQFCRQISNRTEMDIQIQMN